MNKVVKKCIDILDGMENTAKAGRVSTSMVWKWLHDKSPVTPESVIPLEIATREKGSEIPRNKFRPDLYPQE